MEDTANQLSTTSVSQPLPKAPQKFKNYNPHTVYYGNVTAIQEQPTATIITYRAVGDHYLRMSTALAIFSVLCGMYGLICTFPALMFSMMSYSAYKRGDVKRALSYGRIALGFNIAAMVTWIVFFITIVSLNIYNTYLSD